MTNKQQTTIENVNRDFEMMVGIWKRESKDDIRATREREYFKTKNERLRARRKDNKRKLRISESRLLLEENNNFLKSVGIFVDISGRRKKKPWTNNVEIEIKSDETQIITEGPAEIIEVTVEAGERFIPTVSAPMSVQSQTSLIPTAVPPKILPRIYIAPAIQKNYVHALNIIEFVPEEEGHETMISLVWNEDRPKPSFPGGGLDPGETLMQCLIRETKEETNLDVIHEAKLIGELQVGSNAWMAIFRTCLPYGQIENLKWGQEQRTEIKGFNPKIEQLFKVVSIRVMRALAAENKLMPNHLKCWRYYETNFLNKK